MKMPRFVILPTHPYFSFDSWTRINNIFFFIMKRYLTKCFFKKWNVTRNIFLEVTIIKCAWVSPMQGFSMSIYGEILAVLNTFFLSSMKWKLMTNADLFLNWQACSFDWPSNLTTNTGRNWFVIQSQLASFSVKSPHQTCDQRLQVAPKWLVLH